MKYYQVFIKIIKNLICIVLSFIKQLENINLLLPGHLIIIIKSFLIENSENVTA